jgi:hypothetical protein
MLMGSKLSRSSPRTTGTADWRAFRAGVSRGKCGGRCPAYFIRREGEVQDANDGAYWVVGRALEEARGRAEKLAAGRSGPFALEQDEDVLDTWFSSGLWPWSIMGWPEKTANMAQFYPAGTSCSFGWRGWRGRASLWLGRCCSGRCTAMR